MMNRSFLYSTLWFVLLVGFLLLLSIRIKTGDKQLPALGVFFSPGSGFWQNAECDNHFKNFELTHESLSESVEVVFDERMVPHIFAKNDIDVAFAQGYIHAMFRLWQMDISYRSVSGNLAEVLGPRLLEIDVKTRREGFSWAAEKALATYTNDPETKAVFQAYTDGVNYWINNLKKNDYPIEFKLLGYAPEPWSLIKSVYVTKSMSRTLTKKNYDIPNSNIKNVFGNMGFDFLFPEYMEGQSPVHPGPWDNFEIKKPVQQENSTTTSESMYGTYEVPDEINNASNFASNNWAISGEKTKNGHPILCNDPHLELTLPSVWFESHIVTPQYNSYGVSLMGSPSIIVGFNEYIAWGITNGAIDVVDWLEIEWKDEKKEQYQLDDQWMDSEIREEVIKVKGQADHIEKVPYTYWGPVVIENGDGGSKDLAMKWSGHDAIWPDEVRCFFKLMASRNYQDYRAAISKFPSLIQNIVFASSEGDIALHTQGYWPVRKTDGRFVGDGSNSSSAWSSYIPFDSIPATINPDRGYVSSANQHVTSKEYPFPYNGHFEAFRGRILNRYLNADLSFTTENMKEIQLSNHSLKAEEALPIMLKLLDKEKLTLSQVETYRELNGWEYKYEPNSSVAVFFNEWFVRFYKKTFDEKEFSSEFNGRMPDQWRIIALLNENPEHDVFDLQATQKQKETASDILLFTFEETWEALDLNNRPFAELNWNLHQLPAINHLGKIAAFSRPVEVGGSKDALNAMTSTHGPSWRQIIELTAEGPIALGVFPGGQSGNPGSKWYDDSVDTWSKGEYHDIILHKKPEDISGSVFTIKMSKK